MKKPKYKNIEELVNAFQSGELSRNEWMIVIDNDNSYLAWTGDPNLEDSRYEEGKKLWCGDSVDPIDLLRILNIPCDGV